MKHLMLMWKIFFFLTLYPAFSNANYDFMARNTQTVYDLNGPIPIVQANQVLQTRDGYIWIASYDGLFRYDGRMTKFFSLEGDGFPSVSITALYEDSRQRLWVGTNNAGLVLMDKGKISIFSIEEGLSSSSVRAVAEDSQGNIYASTVFGVVRISPELEVEPLKVEGREEFLAIDIMVSSEDELWCVLNNGAVLVVRDSQVTHEFAPRHFNELIINSVFQSSAGDIYLGSTDTRAVIISPSGAYRLVDTGDCSTINSFNQDSAGRIWVSSDTGIGFFEDNQFFPVPGTLISASIENMIEDYEGNLWFASSRHGVLEVTRSKFVQVSQRARLPEMTVNATHMYNGDLFIATDEGLFIMDHRYMLIQTPLTDYLRGTRLRSLLADGQGNLWICTYTGKGLIIYRPDGSFDSINDGPLRDKVRCVIPSRFGGVIAGGSLGVAIVRDGQVVRSYGRQEGLTNPVILSLYEDENGVIYAGSDGGGIYRLEGDEVSVYSERDGLSSSVILRMAADPEFGGVWISTGNGLNFMDENGIRNIDKLGSAAANIYDIQMVDQEGIWLLGSGGIISGLRSNLLSGDPLEVEKFQRRDGLTYPLTANSWNYMAPDGTLYISCTKGVLSIDTDDVYRNLTIPKLLISQVEVDGQVHDHPASLVLSSDTNRLNITFSLLSFTAATGNSATVFLKGFDKNPETLPTEVTTTVSYTNLPGGEYVFEVSGVNKDGIESQTVALSVVKQPHFMERPIVRVGLGALVIGLAVLGGYLYNIHKTRAILKKQQEYRDITQQAIKAIADTIDAKDRYTAGHSHRVAEYSMAIARRMHFSEKQLEDLYYTALLHDIGKVGLEDQILNKQAALTDGEYMKMKNHVRVGGEILKSITVVKDIATGAKYHHERYDGKGYCEGLKAEEIPLFARIICVADSYDAMNSDRPYRKGLPQDVIIAELRRGAGTQFDAKIVAIMVDIINER
ncbi:hypothetical protein C4J81_18165 [Deltaproteobacteria bacterium Smac51]|nr:hypothetical protein C4J81_18165 [Deltaproteobacteria bacterium Smac51]